jgi:hypothetical protein
LVRRLVSALLLFHLVALGVAAMSPPPLVSPLEREVASLFAPYYDLVDQGYAYRYYAPEPPPTPVMTAAIHFRDGRPNETVRLPDRTTRPRLRYQRQLALAYHLFEDFQAAKREAGEGERSRWAGAFARHLCRRRPGCSGITLFMQLHLIPDPQRIRDLQAERRSLPVDLDAEEFYTAPERIGDFACDAS